MVKCNEVASLLSEFSEEVMKVKPVFLRNSIFYQFYLKYIDQIFQNYQ